VLPQAKVVLFGDDTTILVIENTLEFLNENVVKVTEQLESWFYENQLIINTDKTKVLFFHGRGPTLMYRPVICLNIRELIYPFTIQFLGIDISDNFSWTDHTQHVCLKLNKALYMIESLHDSVILWALKNVYLTKFESILKYGIIFWGGGPKTPKQLLKLKKKSLKVIMGIKNRASCRSLFSELEILTVTSLYIFEILCFIIKSRIYIT
jgi:hypothetical protein